MAIWGAVQSRSRFFGKLGPYGPSKMTGKPGSYASFKILVLSKNGFFDLIVLVTFVSVDQLMGWGRRTRWFLGWGSQTTWWQLIHTSTVLDLTSDALDSFQSSFHFKQTPETSPVPTQEASVRIPRFTSQPISEKFRSNILKHSRSGRSTRLEKGKVNKGFLIRCTPSN